MQCGWSPGGRLEGATRELVVPGVQDFVRPRTGGAVASRRCPPYLATCTTPRNTTRLPTLLGIPWLQGATVRHRLTVAGSQSRLSRCGGANWYGHLLVWRSSAQIWAELHATAHAARTCGPPGDPSPV